MANKAAIDQTLQQAADTGTVPGVVAAAADVDGVIYDAAFGRLAVSRPAGMALDTVFHIASMTKAITGAGAMQLVEQGSCRLDQPARRDHRPAWRAAGAGRVRCRRRAEAATGPRHHHAAQTADPHGGLRL